MKNLIFSLAVLAMLVTSCTQKKSSGSLDGILIFEGVLPCADCSGIQTTLTLFPENETDKEHKFELTRVYQGKEPGNKFVDTGNYTIKKGFDDDKDAIVYILNWDKSKEEQESYVIYSKDKNTLHKLDIDGHKIESQLNYSLIKKE